MTILSRRNGRSGLRPTGAIALGLVGGLTVGLAVVPPSVARALPAGPTAPTAPAAPGVAVNPSDDDGSVSPEEKALQQAKSTNAPAELVTARTERSDTWANPDGTFSVRHYGTPVRVLRGGAWVATDPTLQFAADGSVRPKAASVTVAFSGGGTGPLLTGVKDGRTLSLSWPKPLPKPTLAGNVATYAEVLPGVDVQLKAEVEGFSQLVVVKTAQAAANPELATLKYTMSTVGVTVATDAATGAVRATDPAGRPVFTSPPPMMWDSTTISSAPPATGPARSAAAPGAEGFAPAVGGGAGDPAAGFEQPVGAKDAVMPTSVSGNTLQITPDQALLTAADTKYPVYIDPSWAWGGRQNWTRVYKKYPRMSFWNANEVARVGYENETNGLSRSFFQLDTSNIKGRKVISSTFRINNVWSWSCQARPVQLWHTGGIDKDTTWEKQPGKIDWLGTVNDAKGWNSGSCPGGNLEWDVTWKMQRVAAAGDPNITLGLYAENEGDTFGWKKFDSKSAYLETKYNDPPLTPSGLGTNPRTDCATGGLIGNTTVSLYALVDDPNAGNLSAQFQIFRGGSLVADKWIPALKGRVSTLVVPDAELPTGDYTWQVRAYDQSEYSGWSTTCRFTVDRTRPARAPKIDSSAFPNGDNGWPAGTGKARNPGDFTIASNGVDDVVRYGYFTDWDQSVKTVDAPAAGGTAKISLKPSGVGPHFVHAFSQDAAGNRSDTATYLFYAGRSQDRDEPYDLNGDGHKDIWSVDSNGTLLTYAGQGNGQFSSATNGGLSFTDPRITYSGDWGEDGYNDLVTLEYDSVDKRRKLWTYPNNGLGTATVNFGKRKQELKVYCPVADPEGTCPSGNDHWQNANAQILSPGDLNGDKIPDLLVRDGKLLWAYYGSRDDYLDNSDPVLVGGDDWDKFTVIAPGDLNGDGVPDLWLRDETNGDILRTFGSKDANGVIDLATWGTKDRVKVGYGVTKELWPTVGSVGDISGDGVPDLWARKADNTLFAWWGQASAGVVWTFSGGWAIDGVVGARIPSGTNLTSGQEYATGTAKLTMQADGNLVLTKAGKLFWASNTGGNPNAFARMQADGNLVVYSADGSKALWSSRTHGKPNSYAMLLEHGVLVIYNAVGQGQWTSNTQGRPDFNADGKTDILTRDANGDVWVYPGSGGSGMSTFGGRYFAGNGWWREYWTGVYATDLNNDGHTDIIGITREGDMWLYAGTGNSGTSTVGARTLIGTGWGGYTTLAFGDVTGDGKTDVIARDGGGELWVYPGTGGTGTSTLGNRFFIGNGWWPANWITIRVADVNGDFKPDIIGRTDGGDLYIFPNTSDAQSTSFGPRYFWGNGFWPGEWNPFVSDFNNDGAAEAVGITKTGDLYDFIPSGRTLVGTGWTSFFEVIL
ncbi:FG-GAP-like repeat-containing protein [Kitasatospora sp. NPDC057965]|uniref:FG-GAP-like repeat-containing protein n=1 Tax=Kitasatospora sp. NPDC057965 TaxID=3346291 RepID=UPI0036D958A5